MYYYGIGDPNVNTFKDKTIKSQFIELCPKTDLYKACIILLFVVSKPK